MTWTDAFGILGCLSPLMFIWLAFDSRKGIRARNKEVEKSWKARYPADKSPKLQTPIPIVSRDGIDSAGEQAEALFSQQSIHRNGDKAIWAVISEFNTIEACRTFMYLTDALVKLGKPQLAKDLLTRMKVEDWYFNEDHKRVLDSSKYLNGENVNG